MQAYRDHKGKLSDIFASVPCSNILEDEERFISIVNEAIDQKELSRTKAWDTVSRPEGEAMRDKLKARARAEAREAEAYAKELGVYDELFGEKREEPRKKRKSEAQAIEKDDDDVDLDALRAAMRKKATDRESAFDSMISRMEAREQPSEPKKSRTKSSKRRS